MKNSIFKIKEKIEEFTFAPEEWDNTRIFIDCNNSNNKVLLTIDLTEEVLLECINLNIQNIIAYHPIIFTGIKNITDPLFINSIKNNISVYCPHTRLDLLMNDYLKELLINKTFDECVSFFKQTLKTIRVVKGEGKELVVGVGSDFKNNIKENSLIVTGEMSHHSHLLAKKKNCSVILLEHSNSERFYVPVLKERLEKELPEFLFFISEKDKDPIEFI